MDNDEEYMIVAAEFGGMRLDEFLQRHHPDIDRRAWRRLLREGSITLNGEVPYPQKRLSVGDVVAVRADLDAEPQRARLVAPLEDPAALRVVYEDEAILVVDKPAGMHTVPDRGGKYRGVHGLLAQQRPDQDLRIVHRLDAPTSGCLAIAKGLEVARVLDAAFRAGEVHKEYLALCEGCPSRPRSCLDAPLGPDPRRPGRIRTVAPGSKGSREARTEIEVLERFRRHALVRALPRTGRTHQIRVHLSRAGHRIVGDPDYGSGRPLLLSQIKSGYKIRRGVVERPLLQRMFLHAEVLELPSPAADGGRARACVPLPRELRVVLDKLRRFAPDERP